MLVTKEVMQTWQIRNKTYFINKGYVYSKIGDQFIVNIADLIYNSQTFVDYECDICKNIFTTSYANCNRNLKLNGIHKCRKCSNAEIAFKKKNNYETILNEFMKHNLILLDDVSLYINNATKLRFKCSKHNNLVQKISYNKLRSYKFPCRLCNNENISLRQRRDKSSSWKGGVSSIHGYLRRELKTYGWYYRSFLETEFKCIISGERAHHVHHLYPFNKILEETIHEFNIEIKDNISKYTDDELLFIKEMFFNVHERYPLGAPLRKDIHKKYHSIYGYDNTIEQFEEFKRNYIK